MSPDQAWPKAAGMVLAELKRQGEVQERHEDQLRSMQRDITERLSSIQIALVTAQTETHGHIRSLEETVKHTASSIGSAPPCKEHSTQLTALTERVEQHHYQQRDKLKGLGDIWTEINKLREWVKSVNDAGLVDHTEGRVRWPWIGAIGAFGGLGGWGAGELTLMILRRLGS